MKKLFFSLALMAVANLTFAGTTQTTTSNEPVVKSKSEMTVNNLAKDQDLFPCTVCISDGTVTICISGECRIIIVIE